MMKMLLLTGLLIVFCMAESLKAQSLRYQKTEDNPDRAINTMINIVPVEAFIPAGKYSALTVGIGAQGVYGFTSRIGFEASASKSYISTNMGKSAMLEGGAFLNLFTKEKTKNTRVLLSYSRKSGVYSTTESISYLEVPAKVKIATGVRGGLYYSESSIKTDGIKIAKAESPFNLAGIYVGLQTTNKHFIKTQLTNEKEPSPTAAIFKLYADAMIFPVSKIKDDMLSSTIKAGNLGARAGLNWVVAPYKKKDHPHYKPIFHRLVINAELGSRPVDGFYGKMGFAYGIFYK